MTEPELQQQLVTALEPYFEVTEQVWLRNPIYGFDLRIDLVAAPRPPLDERLPFAFLGIEVKVDNHEFAARTQAFKQCLDYKQCVLNDQRLPKLRGLWLPCVALYRGRERRTRRDEDPAESLLVRLVGKFNVGELEHGHYDGLMLLVCNERIWCVREGISDGKMTWPTARLVANSTRRV